MGSKVLSQTAIRRYTKAQASDSMQKPKKHGENIGQKSWAKIMGKNLSLIIQPRLLQSNQSDKLVLVATYQTNIGPEPNCSWTSKNGIVLQLQILDFPLQDQLTRGDQRILKHGEIPVIPPVPTEINLIKVKYSRLLSPFWLVFFCFLPLFTLDSPQRPFFRMPSAIKH